MFEENVTIYSGVPPEEMPMQAEPQIAQEVLPEPIVEPPALMQPEPAANSLADRELSFAKAGDKLKEFIPKEDGRVVTIDGGSQVETEDEKQRRNLYELISSLRSKAVLTGRIEGVESSSGGDPRAIVYRGTYKILIPSFEIIDPPDDFRGMDPNEVMVNAGDCLQVRLLYPEGQSAPERNRRKPTLEDVYLDFFPEGG